jgi:RNA polymerase sigma factor (sigma-70 family)
MRDRDAEDGRLLGAGRHDELLASYYETIRTRLLVRLPRDDADEVAHRVVDRLIGELARGKTYSVPFRVVVHQVIGWKLKEHFAERRHEPLPEEPDLPDETAEDPDERIALAQMLADLPPRSREVLELRYLDGLEIVQIAERLSMTRNAVDQALFRGRRRLKELLRARP